MRPSPRLVTFEDGSSAVLALTEERVGRAKSTRSAPAGTYGGWVSGSPLTEGHERALADVLLAIPGLIWRISPFNTHVPPPPDCEPDSTHVLNLERGIDAALEATRSAQRQHARRAEKAGVHVAVATAPEDWSSYLELYRLSRARWGDAARSEPPAAVFHALQGEQDTGVALWLATVDEGAVAGAIVLSTPAHACYWHGSATEAGLKLGATPYVLLRAAESAAAHGARWFDFNPSAGLEGVRRFKVRMGGMEVAAPVMRTSLRRRRAVLRR